MDVRTAKVEASYQHAEQGVSFRLGPGLAVDLDEELHAGIRVRDVFNADHFEPKSEPEVFVPPVDDETVQ
jgi:hypothetical protein